jgi:hypothetical protein
MKFGRIGRRLWRRPRPKLGCGAKNRERYYSNITLSLYETEVKLYYVFHNTGPLKKY